MAERRLLALLDAVFRPWMRRRVAGVRIAGAAGLPADGRPVLLCPNHVSWWDGFVARDVARELRPGAPFHAVMPERELRRRPWLRLLGAVGLEPGSAASVRRMLVQIEEITAEEPSSVVTLFPQGRIWPSDRRPLGFRGGVALFRRALPGCWTVPVAIRMEPLGDPRPTAFVSVGAPLAPAVPEGEVVERLERRVADELDAVGFFLALHGEDAADRWPGPDGRLPRAPGPADFMAPTTRPGRTAGRPSLN